MAYDRIFCFGIGPNRLRGKSARFSNQSLGGATEFEMSSARVFTCKKMCNEISRITTVHVLVQLISFHHLFYIFLINSERLLIVTS